ncbi:unnamed protein product [Penicillium bialowiezense]
MTRLHTTYPSAPPYSESHARFWLDDFTPGPSASELDKRNSRESWEPSRFVILVAQGKYGIHGLEAEHLAQASAEENPEGHCVSEQKDRIGEERAGRWVKEALGIMEPYVRMWHGVWPGVEERGEMLRRMLVENSQLFARWRVSPLAKQLTFGLGPRE